MPRATARKFSGRRWRPKPIVGCLSNALVAAVGLTLVLTGVRDAAGAVVTHERTLQGPLQSEFGAAVTTHTGTVVVGAPNAQLAGGVRAGAVYVYVAETGAPGSTPTFAGPSPVAGDRFGAALAVTGTSLFVGAPDAGSGARSRSST